MLLTGGKLGEVERNCMQCDRPMVSTGPHHRHCKRCRERIFDDVPPDEYSGLSKYRNHSPKYLQGKKHSDFDEDWWD